jgi:hypothetical protein
MPKHADGPPTDSGDEWQCEECDAAWRHGQPQCWRCGNRTRVPAVDPPTDCDVRDCDRRADYAYIGESGDFYLCEYHFHTNPHWRRIEHDDG